MVVLEKLQEEENLASTKTMFGSGDITYGSLCPWLNKACMPKTYSETASFTILAGFAREWQA